MRCDNEKFTCYVIDNNAYIVLSNNSEDTGRFFGEVEGRAMQKLADLEVFKAITVYDYQAVCKRIKADEDGATSFGTILLTVNQALSKTTTNQ